MRFFLRKVLHLILGLSLAFSSLLFGLKITLLLVGIFELFFLYETFKKKHKIGLFLFLVKSFEKEKEMHIKGLALHVFLSSFILSSLVFRNYFVVSLSFFVLSIGDFFSGVVGYYFGKHKVGELSLEGSLAFFFSTFVFLFFFFRLSLLKAFFISLFSSLSEYLPLDDNYVIPLMVGGLFLIFSNI